MNVRRTAASAGIVAAAVVAAPSALLPGINSADPLVILAPLALVAVWLMPRRSQTPAGGNPPAAIPPQVAAPPAGSHD